MKRVALRAAAVSAVLLMAACSKVFLQDDGFAEKLQAGCSDEAACLRLQVEADQRIVRCQPNTDGYVRCADAKADKLLADSYVARYVDARRQDEKQKDEQRRQEAENERAEARARVETERKQRERDALLAEIDRDKKMLDACAATEPGRAARKRREGILENGIPGDAVRKQCPKTMDEEVVQLGLYQLRLLDDYPYPDDRVARAGDAQCERARERSKQLSDRLERSAK